MKRGLMVAALFAVIGGATGFIEVIFRGYHSINKTYWTTAARRPTLTAYRGPLRAVGGADVPQIPNCSFAKSNSQVEQILSSSCSNCPHTPVSSHSCLRAVGLAV